MTTRSTVVQFLGAAGTVTGSRFLIECGDSRILVDAGMFQGLKRDRVRNWEPFPVDPAGIDAVLLTHAHIDHSGYLPRLVALGFNGPILCTQRTMELCGVLLPDAAHIQEEEARFANERGYSKHHPALPLFTKDDAEAALSQFRAIEFGEPVEVTGDVTCTFHPAGHILGSASILVQTCTGDRVLVSGDLGRGDHPILDDPAAPPAADIVLLESTYGDRLHPVPDAEVEELARAISESASRGGMILIPAFAVDRTEVVLLLLHELMESGRIPRLPIHADSPMALRVLDIYRDAIEAGDLDIRHFDDPPPLDAGTDIHAAHTVEQSKALADLTYPSIIISASGMATGGRVLHHLSRLLPGGRNTVVLSGFQAAGTRGRLLSDGARAVKMLGRHVPVRARIVAMESLSVHADAAELVEWVGRMSPPPGVVYTVHGEPEAGDRLCTRLAAELDVLAVRPRHGERIVVSG